MGRIAEAVNNDCEAVERTNKVDRVLESLDDDDDRAVVLSWLLSDMGDQDIEDRLYDHGIKCSDSTIRLWRHYQRRGVGRQWGA